MVQKYSQHFRTKRLIADRFAEMVLEMPLENIRVNDLCERCGISRHTFYYHFRDKYEIARWLHYAECRDALEASDVSDSAGRWAYTYRSVLLKRKDYYRRLFQYHGQNSLLYQLVYDTVRIYRQELTQHLKPEDRTPELEMEIYYHSYGSVMTIMEWIMRDIDLTPEQVSRIVLNNLPQQLKDIMYFHSDIKPVIIAWEDVIQKT